MNIEEYLQLMAMNPQPTPGPAPNVPHGTMEAPQDVGQFDPLSAGASKAMQSMRETMGMQPRGGIRHMLGRTAGDLAYGFLKGSDHPILQAMAERYEIPYDQEEKEIAKNQQIMRFLQEASAAKKLDEYRRNQLMLGALGQKETERHHRASEGLAREKLGMEKESANEAKNLENEFFQETGVHGKWMGNYGEHRLGAATKRQVENVKKHEAALSAYEAANTLKYLAVNDPHIFNSTNFSIINKYLENPTVGNSLLQKLVPEEDRQKLIAAFAASKTLKSESVQNVPAKGLNQNIEKVMFGGTAGPQMTAKNVENLADKAIAASSHFANQYEKTRDYYDRGFEVLERPRQISSLENKETPSPETGGQTVTIRNPSTGETKQVILRNK